jgi:hypothetical protein
MTKDLSIVLNLFKIQGVQYVQNQDYKVAVLSDSVPKAVQLLANCGYLQDGTNQIKIDGMMGLAKRARYSLILAKRNGILYIKRTAQYLNIYDFAAIVPDYNKVLTGLFPHGYDTEVQHNGIEFSSNVGIDIDEAHAIFEKEFPQYKITNAYITNDIFTMQYLQRYLSTGMDSYYILNIRIVS